MRPKSLNDLEIALRQNRWLAEILERFEEIGLPDSWLVAGSIAQTIWNLGCGQTAEFGIKDVDLICFDQQDLSLEAEIAHCPCEACYAGWPPRSRLFIVQFRSSAVQLFQVFPTVLAHWRQRAGSPGRRCLDDGSTVFIFIHAECDKSRAKPKAGSPRLRCAPRLARGGRPPRG